MSNDAIIRQEVADLRSHAEHESHQLASEAMASAADTIESLLTTLDGLRNDAMSLTLQRDQAVRECERLRQQLAERDARYSHEKQDADGDPASLCNICKGMIRYGERHSTCGAAFMEVEKQLSAVTAERDRLGQQVQDLTNKLTAKDEQIEDHTAIGAALLETLAGAYPTYSWMNCPTEVVCDLLNEKHELEAELQPYRASLSEVRGEMQPEIEQTLDFLGIICAFSYQNGYIAHGYNLVENVRYAIDTLQRSDARNRNALLVAQETIAGLRQYHDWAEPQVQRLGREVVARESAEARARELQKLCVTARDTLGYLADMHQLSPSDAKYVTELSAALSPPPPADEGLQAFRGRTPEQYAIEHGRYLATAAQGFMDACNKVWISQAAIDDDETDTQNQADRLLNKLERAKESQSEGWCRLESAIYEFTKRADRAYPAAAEQQGENNGTV